MTIIPVSDATTPISVSMGGDMSASRRSSGYFLGPEASAITLDVSWPATGSPVGAFKVEFFSDAAASSGTAHPIFSNAAVIAGQPSGGAGSLVVDRMRTGCAYACVSYTATSGGTGATPTVKLTLKRS